MLMNFEAERARHGLTKTEMSDLMGVTLKTYAMWIQEKSPIPSNKLMELKKQWGVSIDYLLETDS